MPAARSGSGKCISRGANNLSFPDITAESLAQLVPDKSTRILIYWQQQFHRRIARASPPNSQRSRSLSTFTALYNYGYRNVHELNVEVKTTILPMVKG